MKNSYKNINDNCSLFIMSCDSYSDIWSFLFDGINTYWPNCPYKIYLCTETKKSFDGHVETINVNYKSWGERLIEGLKQVPTDYVFFLIDDLPPGEIVDQNVLDYCLNYLDSDKKISNIYVSSCMDENTKELKVNIPYFDEKKRELTFNYRLNAAPAFWRKEKLIEFTKKTDSPWVWEVFGTIRIYKYKDKVLSLSKDLSYPYKVVCASGAIVKGKWNTLFVEKIKDRYLNFDFSVRGIANISDANRPLSFAEKIAFLYDGFVASGYGPFLYIVDYIKQKIKK